jgi:hypothetical protein
MKTRQTLPASASSNDNHLLTIKIRPRTKVLNNLSIFSSICLFNVPILLGPIVVRSMFGISGSVGGFLHDIKR